MPRVLKFEERLKRYSPLLCRLLAVRGPRNGKVALTDTEIAEGGGLSIADVKRISYSTTWDDVPWGKLQRYLSGCRLQLERRRPFQQLEWLRESGSFTHLKRSPLFEGQFREMIELWVASEEVTESKSIDLS